jgi:DNA-binding IclR family transcriptional regulator
MTTECKPPVLLRDRRRRAPLSPGAKIEAVATASAIVDFLAESTGPVGVQRVAAVLGMTKSRASRHLANLESLGLVGRKASGRGYHLGWRAMRWGQLAAGLHRMNDALAVPIQHINSLTQRSVLLCTPAGCDVIVSKCFSAHSVVKKHVEPGLVLCLPQSPSALVAFAWHSPLKRAVLLDELERRDPDYRVEDMTEFRRQLASIRTRFYCWTADKYDLGCGAVAAPVFGAGEELAAVLTLMLPSSKLDRSAPPAAILKSLLTCGAVCSRSLHSRTAWKQLLQAASAHG